MLVFVRCIDVLLLLLLLVMSVFVSLLLLLMLSLRVVLVYSGVIAGGVVYAAVYDGVADVVAGVVVAVSVADVVVGSVGVGGSGIVGYYGADTGIDVVGNAVEDDVVWCCWLWRLRCYGCYDCWFRDVVCWYCCWY